MFGRVVDYQARQIAYNAYIYFKKRKKLSKEDDVNLIETVSEVTGLSKSTVTRVVREGNAMEREFGVVVFKKQEQKHSRKKRINIDAYRQSIIRRKVIQFYSKKNEVPSVKTLNAALKREGILKCSDEYLRQLLHKLGFSNLDGASDGLSEDPEIVLERKTYIRKLKEMRAQRRPIFFFNETKRWLQIEDTDTEYARKMPSLIIIHAGGQGLKNGKPCMYYLKSKNDDQKPQDSFNWFKNKILPLIPPKSVIVVNTPYNETPESAAEDKKPIATSQRATMEQWLNRHKIPFVETLKKPALFDLITAQEMKLKYSITNFIKNQEYELLFLPQNHSDLNPGTILWDKIQDKVESIPVEKLIDAHSEEDWKECYEHLEQNENYYHSQDSDARKDNISGDFMVEVKTEVMEHAPYDELNMD